MSNQKTFYISLLLVIVAGNLYAQEKKPLNNHQGIVGTFYLQAFWNEINSEKYEENMKKISDDINKMFKIQPFTSKAEVAVKVTGSFSIDTNISKASISITSFRHRILHGKTTNITTMKQGKIIAKYAFNEKKWLIGKTTKNSKLQVANFNQLNKYIFPIIFRYYLTDSILKKDSGVADRANSLFGIQAPIKEIIVYRSKGNIKVFKIEKTRLSALVAQTAKAQFTPKLAEKLEKLFVSEKLNLKQFFRQNSEPGLYVSLLTASHINK